MQTWNKQTGISVKDRTFSYPTHVLPQVLIQYMDSYWGVQVSYCTGVARRFHLRKLAADLIPHFTAGSTFDPTSFESKLRDDSLRPAQKQFWLEGLDSAVGARILNLIFGIMDTLRRTGLDSTGDFFCVA